VNHLIYYGAIHDNSDTGELVTTSHQLPVWMQLAIFLNGAGHYGNAGQGLQWGQFMPAISE